MPGPIDWLMLAFLFALGASVGSFLNVVVFRLPATEIPPTAGAFEIARRQLRGISTPPSHCPRCGYQLRWFDNVPVLGWIWLGGKCRKCRLPISVQYPLIEALVGLVFAGYYVTFFLLGPSFGPPTPAALQAVTVDAPAAFLQGESDWEEHVQIPATAIPPDVAVSQVLPGSGIGFGPWVAVELALRSLAEPARDWPVFAMTLALAACLLAAALIDARHFYIPRALSYLPAAVGLTIHTLVDGPLAPLSVMVGPVGCAWAIGGGVGLLLALGLVRFRVLKRSFADELPPLEVDRESAGQETVSDEEWQRLKRLTRREMWREVAFLALPVGLGLLAAVSAAHGPARDLWQGLAEIRPVAALCGSLLGGLVGGGVIWIIRVLGSLGFGREAMGLGDADLMFGVGCCLGAGPAGVAAFPAAIIGVGFALYRWAARSRHEMPFGPYLAIASLLLVIGWNELADWFRPSLPALELLLGPAAPLVGL